MDGYYEWRANADTDSGKKSRKTPFFMHRADGDLLFMAGLWSVWKSAKDATPLLSCTIITTDAVGELAGIHDRMPLIVAERDWDRWLDPDAPADLDFLAAPPNIDGIGLKELGVAMTDRGFIKINEKMETSVKGVYAIGDVAGPPMLAHKAEHEAVICVEAIKGLHPHPMDKLMIPGCTYCHPQIASVGLTEAKAKAAGHEIKVGRFNFVANGKAVALGEDSGLAKTIFDAKTGKLLGAHLVGPEVTERLEAIGRHTLAEFGYA